MGREYVYEGGNWGVRLLLVKSTDIRFPAGGLRGALLFWGIAGMLDRKIYFVEIETIGG